MGAVYRAKDLNLGVTVVVKENLIHSEEARRQFNREAGILANMRHPCLPRVTDVFFLPEQGQYLVMDYVEGEDLKQLVARWGPIPEAQALAWLRCVLDALEYLHDQNIIHRDVKPANVKITPDGQVYLVDFGLAKIFDPSQETTIGARGVTPGYAPPEQYGRGRTDARSDVYSVAATLYALLTGKAPPDGLELTIDQVKLVPPRQLAPGISPRTEAAILKAMESRPTSRFSTVADLRTALFGPVVPAPQPTPGRQPALPSGPLHPAPVKSVQPSGAPPRPSTDPGRRPQPAPERQLPVEPPSAEPAAEPPPRPAVPVQPPARSDRPPSSPAELPEVPAQIPGEAARRAPTQVVEPRRAPDSEPRHRPPADGRPPSQPEVQQPAEPDHPPTRVVVRPRPKTPAVEATPHKPRHGVPTARAAKPALPRWFWPAAGAAGVLLAVIVLALIILFSGGNEPAADSATGAVIPGVTLLFVSDRDGKREIYGLTHGKVERLTRAPGRGESWGPVVEPDGDVLFTSDRDGKREVYRLTDGQAVRVTQTVDPFESWAPYPEPDGDFLFTSNRSGKREVYRFGTEGIVKVTNTPGDAESWSPIAELGGDILFSSNRDGKDEIYRLGSGSAIRVTNTPGIWESWNPIPEPDGDILFTSNRGGKREVYRLMDGQGIRVTNTAGRHESWSPFSEADGDILFTSNRDGKREIYRFESGSPIRVTNTAGSAESWWER
jgi:serine/threonine protein kinase/Tol biopolymer transport system component